MNRNNEGYPDPTASMAIQEVDRPPENVTQAIKLMKFTAKCFGCELSGRIWLRDVKTGKEYR